MDLMKLDRIRLNQAELYKISVNFINFINLHFQKGIHKFSLNHSKFLLKASKFSLKASKFSLIHNSFNQKAITKGF